MKSIRAPRIGAFLAALSLAISTPMPAKAAGDLLVAPTRIVLDGRRGTEVILNNVGVEEATYRISLELRRMNDIGKLDDVTPEEANATEKAALEMIRFAPRRVTLPPNQPQSIRIGLQGTESLPDGEYRAHMLFRAIPKAPDPVAEDAAATGLKINLIPVYGVTIPVIVRKGDLKATAAIADARLTTGDIPELQFHLTREGTRSVFGEVHVTKPGVAEPVLVAKGIAVYPERSDRRVALPLNPEQLAKLQGGDTVISYYEAPEAGGGLIAQLRTVLR